jgi:hypothetical protein
MQRGIVQTEPKTKSGGLGDNHFTAKMVCTRNLSIP